MWKRFSCVLRFKTRYCGMLHILHPDGANRKKHLRAELWRRRRWGRRWGRRRRCALL